MITGARTTRETTPLTPQQINEATEAGLVAAGNVLVNAIKRALRGGYKSSLGNKGDFTTGTSINHVRARAPRLKNGEWSVTVATDLLYNLFWELGHHNIFTRRYERDEKWGPAVRESRDAAFAAFRRVYQRIAAKARAA